jgi:hypothetical protein
MTVGLTSEELLTAFFERWEAQVEEFRGEIQAIVAGESPEGARKLFDMMQRSPIQQELAVMLTCIIKAVMDTIAANNAAIAKSIPKVKP